MVFRYVQVSQVINIKNQSKFHRISQYFPSNYFLFGDLADFKTDLDGLPRDGLGVGFEDGPWEGALVFFSAIFLWYSSSRSNVACFAVCSFVTSDLNSDNLFVVSWTSSRWSFSSALPVLLWLPRVLCEVSSCSRSRCVSRSSMIWRLVSEKSAERLSTISSRSATLNWNKEIQNEMPME